MRMSHLIVLFALAVPAAAQTTVPATPLQKPAAAAVVPPKPPDALQVLQAEWDALAKSAVQPGADPKSFDKQRADVARRALALMERDPRGELAVRTRIWLALGSVEMGASDRLLDELMTQDLASPALVELADQLRPGSRPRAKSLLATLSETAGDRTVRGRSLRMLADHAKADLDLVRAVENGSIPPASLEKSQGPERAAELRKLGTAGVQAQYEALLDRVVKDYADVPDARGRTIGARAESTLFELRNLAIGKVAPEIEGEDLDGVKFKLGDYRGKVVVLDFWGNW